MKIKFEGFLPVLALIFITLKLTGHIEWGWVFVLSPLLFVLVTVLIICVFKFVLENSNK